MLASKRLGCTDVGSRFFAADVLLASLQRHAQRVVAVAVLAYTDDAAGNLAFVLVAGREVSSVWATKAHRYTEALAVANYGIRSPHSPGGVSSVSASKSAAATVNTLAAFALITSSR